MVSTNFNLVFIILPKHAVHYAVVKTGCNVRCLIYVFGTVILNAAEDNSLCLERNLSRINIMSTVVSN